MGLASSGVLWVLLTGQQGSADGICLIYSVPRA